MQPRRGLSAFLQLFKALLLDYRTARLELAEQRSRPRPIAPERLPLAMCLGVAGLIYVAVFAPALAWTTASSGVDPLAVALLQHLPRSIHEAGSYFTPAGRPNLCALGLFYGVIGVVAALIFVAGGIIQLVIVSNGLAWGYLATYVVVSAVGWLPAGIPIRAAAPRFAYVLMSFYLSYSLTTLFGGTGHERLKFESFFSGIQGLIAGLILGYGFGERAVVFSGSVYLLLTFVSIAVMERVVLPALRVAEKIAGLDLWTNLDEQRAHRWADFRTAVTELLAHRDTRHQLAFGATLFCLFPLLGLGVIYLLSRVA